MTLALIVLVVFLIVWFNQSTKNKSDKQAHRKRTITNIALQDELSAKNFALVISDLNEIANTKNLSGDTLIDTLEGMYQTYDLPDRRSDTDKINDRKKYLSDLANAIADEDYPVDDSKLPLADKIWHYPFCAPHIERPELLFGNPNTTEVIDGIKYKYDHRGIANHFYWTIPAKLFGDIVVLRTIRELDEEGYRYSWKRQEANWQKAEKEAEQYKYNKDKYPWLYK